MDSCSKYCNKKYLVNKIECEPCGEIMTKYLARLEDPGIKEWETKTVPTLKLEKKLRQS